MSYFSFGSKQRKKCAVIGCHGTGGMIAYALAQSGMPDSLVLLDNDSRQADGHAADLLGALPPRSGMDIWAGEFSDLADCKLIVLATGLPALHENAHTDLVTLNEPLIRQALSQIASYNQDAVVLVVTDPVDVMTHVSLQHTRFDTKRIIGIGTLPLCLRYRALLAKYLGADAAQVQSMVLGQADEHATLIKSSLQVCGIPVESYLQSLERSSDMSIPYSLFDDAIYARSRAENAKGQADFSIAHAALYVADAVLHDRNTILPLSRLPEGFGDLPQICMSLPCRLGGRGAEVMRTFPLASAELEQLQKSAARLRTRLLDRESFSRQ